MELTYRFSSLLTMSILLLCTPFCKCNELVDHDLIKIDLPPNVFAPEDFAFDCNGEGPYTGVSDGRVLKWGGAHVGWTEFAITSPNRNREVCDGSTDTKNEEMCGRPLGLQFHKETCDLYIAGAYYGLLVVGPKGGLATQLASSAGGVPFRFLNGLDVDESSGSVYFTESSSVYQRREVTRLFTNGDNSGRLMKYDIKQKKVTILVDHLHFAHGVAVSKNKDFILFSETSRSTVSKYWLQGPKSYTWELLTKIDGYPDNISRTENGDFWIGQGINVVMGIKIDGEGKLLKKLNAKVGENVLVFVTEVLEKNGSLWIGSYQMPLVGLIKSDY